MKRIAAGLLIAAALAVGASRDLAAQCDADCSVLTMPDGSRTFTCYRSPESGVRCLSTTSSCRLMVCETGLLIDAAGHRVGLASACGDSVTVRPLTRGPRERVTVRLPARGASKHRAASHAVAKTQRAAASSTLYATLSRE
jgi:hypothetical protein